MISKELREEVHKCIKCGLCINACPVYKQLYFEGAAPRGNSGCAGAEERDQSPSHFHRRDSRSHTSPRRPPAPKNDGFGVRGNSIFSPVSSFLLQTLHHSKGENSVSSS